MTLRRAGADLGIITPVVTQLPGAHAGWESSAGIGAILQVARRADELGFHHLTCSEHVAVPTEDAKVRGATYWDPLSTFGAVAAHTSQIQLATYVLVLGYHHPVEIVKRYGTLDRISGGRVVLGVGVGSLEAEFDLIGAEFEGRGERADDALRAIRASWARSDVAYEGSHYAFDGFTVEPHAVRHDPPIWVGGRTRRSLRRATELATGWAPFWLGREEVRSMLAAADVPDDFEVVAQPTRALDPTGDPEGTDRAIADWVEVGATVVEVRVVHRSLEHYLEQLEALAS